MAELKDFTHRIIDWNLTPEHAVTMYLEWGNNDWQSEYPPVRSKTDVSTYFVVDTWEGAPIIRLVQRNSERADDLLVFPLPERFLAGFYAENGKNKGIYTPTDEIKAWLRSELGQNIDGKPRSKT